MLASKEKVSSVGVTRLFVACEAEKAGIGAIASSSAMWCKFRCSFKAGYYVIGCFLNGLIVKMFGGIQFEVLNMKLWAGCWRPLGWMI
jgi:hypothetical protein